MKRVILTFSCIISVLWLMPLFVHAAYTAPDGNEYEYRFYASTGDYNTRYYTIYTNNKVCRLSGSNWNTFVTLFPRQNLNEKVCATMITSVNSFLGDDGIVTYPSGGVVSVQTDDYGFYVWENGNVVPSRSDNLYDYNTTNNIDDCPIFSTAEECYDYLTTPDVDFENLFYDPTIPTPEFVVTMERPTPWQDVTTDTNFFDITWNEYAGYYVQIGYKFSYPNGMKVALVDGQTTFTPLTYANSQYMDVWPLELMHDALYINSLVNANSFELESAMIQDSESWQTSVPIWANNFNNSAYTKARNTWNTKMRYCWPLYGLKLEIFERLFYVADGVCYVGAWKHWNNSYPSDYQEEIPNNYQVGSSMPGYSNTSNNTEYQDLEYTETSIGTQTGTNSNPTVVVNNLTPNYPDYPTVATYNHDNILLQMIQTAKQLPQFFGDFSGFLAAAFVFIPSEIWTIIGFGFLCSIIVMIVKVL